MCCAQEAMRFPQMRFLPVFADLVILFAVSAVRTPLLSCFNNMLLTGKQHAKRQIRTSTCAYTWHFFINVDSGFVNRPSIRGGVPSKSDEFPLKGDTPVLINQGFMNPGLTLDSCRHNSIWSGAGANAGGLRH